MRKRKREESRAEGRGEKKREEAMSGEEMRGREEIDLTLPRAPMHTPFSSLSCEVGGTGEFLDGIWLVPGTGPRAVQGCRGGQT